MHGALICAVIISELLRAIFDGPGCPAPLLIPENQKGFFTCVPVRRSPDRVRFKHVHWIKHVCYQKNWYRFGHSYSPAWFSTPAVNQILGFGDVILEVVEDPCPSLVLSSISVLHLISGGESHDCLNCTTIAPAKDKLLETC